MITTVVATGDSTNIIATVVTGVGALFTAVVGLFTLIRSGKDKNDRTADRTVAQRTADKIEAEKNEIIQRTKLAAIQDIQDELADTKAKLIDARRELEEAYEKADRLREVLVEKNDQIDTQDRIIRRLTRRAEALEEWITSNADRFEQLGITPLPEDILLDRQHSSRKEEAQ